VEHIGKVLERLGHEIPTQNQKTIEPEPDAPTLEQRREELRKSLGVSSLENTFENFKPVAGTQKALAAFKALAEGKARWKMLLCYGGVGCGKSHLLEATAIALYKREVRCRVSTMARIMQALKHAIECDKHGNEGKPWEPYDNRLTRLCNMSHLMIDDVGMGGSGSEWEFGQLEEIVVARYRERLFTILTTNRDLTELPERVVSRFRDPDVGRVVLNSGDDFRRLKGGVSREKTREEQK